jgi:hypothetical protein
MEKPKHVKAIWDAAAHRVFLDVCIEEVNKNNRPVQVLNNTGYANLVKNFNMCTKRNYDRKQMKKSVGNTQKRLHFFGRVWFNMHLVLEETLSLIPSMLVTIGGKLRYN